MCLFSLSYFETVYHAPAIDAMFYLSMADNKTCLNRKFCTSLAKCFACCRLINTVYLKEYTTPKHWCLICLDVSFSFTHTYLRSFLRIGPVREYTNPNTSTLTHSAVYRTTSRLYLVTSNTSLLTRFESKRSKRDRDTSLCRVTILNSITSSL